MDSKKPEASPVDRLRDRLMALVSEQTQILQTAQAATRDLTDDETAKLVEIENAQKKLETEIARYLAAAEAQARLTAPAPSPISSPIVEAQAAERQPQPQPIRSPITGRDIAATSKTHGFASDREWFKAIRTAQSNPSLTDRRLTAAQAAATTFANEGAGPDGGWAMPPDFAAGIVQAVMGQATLLGRMNVLQSSSNIYQIPIDETTPWGTTGIQAAKTAEGVASTVSNLVLQQRVVTLYKATAMVNVSEELSTDNPATVQHISRTMGERLQALVERWILQGSGAGEPFGILKAPAYVSVAADGSQTAGTITKTNLSKCVGRLLPNSRAGAFWVASPSAEIGMMDVLLAAGGNTGTNLQNGFGATVLGIPIVPSIEAPVIGAVGDCTLVAPSGFLTLVKGGVQSQATIYFYFDQGLTTLRSYIRLGQVPLLSAAVTPKLDTATTLSHCVGIAAR